MFFLYTSKQSDINEIVLSGKFIKVNYMIYINP